VGILNGNQGVIALIALLVLVIQLMLQAVEGAAKPPASVQIIINQNVTIIDQGHGRRGLLSPPTTVPVRHVTGLPGLTAPG
jgi:hypothetical protein